MRQLENLGRYTTAVPGVKDQVWWPLYDFQRIEKLRDCHYFFQIPIGGIGMEPKTEADTNMYLTGQLPSENAFLATGVRVVFIPDCDSHRGRYRQDMQDIKRVLLAGTLRFRIQNRIYTQGAPLARFPACFPLFAHMDENFFRRALRKRSLFRIQKESYYKIVPVFIQSNQHFEIAISFDLKQRVALNSPGRLGIVLDGSLIRDAS